MVYSASEWVALSVLSGWKVTHFQELELSHQSNSIFCALNEFEYRFNDYKAGEEVSSREQENKSTRHSFLSLKCFMARFQRTIAFEVNKIVDDSVSTRTISNAWTLVTLKNFKYFWVIKKATDGCCRDRFRGFHDYSKITFLKPHKETFPGFWVLPYERIFFKFPRSGKKILNEISAHMGKIAFCGILSFSFAVAQE